MQPPSEKGRAEAERRHPKGKARQMRLEGAIQALGAVLVRHLERVPDPDLGWPRAEPPTGLARVLGFVRLGFVCRRRGGRLGGHLGSVPGLVGHAFLASSRPLRRAEVDRGDRPVTAALAPAADREPDNRDLLPRHRTSKPDAASGLPVLGQTAGHRAAIPPRRLVRSCSNETPCGSLRFRCDASERCRTDPRKPHRTGAR